MPQLYYPRHVDATLNRALKTAGAVHIQGPRGCGKTLTARQVCESSVSLDQDTPEANLAKLQPTTALPGPTPRLLDEWQVLPQVWNAVRHEVDTRRTKGQFVLTGSSWPEDSGVRHSGAGRFRTITMRTTTCAERDLSSGAVSLSQLMSGEVPTARGEVDPAALARWLCHGGLPAVWDDDVDVARDLAASSVDDIVHRDLASQAGPGRDPLKFRRF